MPPVSDLVVYQRLATLAEELDRMADEASLIGNTALKTAAMSLRGMAQAIYEHSLGEDPGAAH